MDLNVSDGLQATAITYTLIVPILIHEAKLLLNFSDMTLVIGIFLVTQ